MQTQIISVNSSQKALSEYLITFQILKSKKISLEYLIIINISNSTLWLTCGLVLISHPLISKQKSLQLRLQDIAI